KHDAASESPTFGAQQRCIDEWRTVAYSMCFAVLTRLQRAASRKIRVSAHSTAACLELLIDQMAGCAIHGLTGKRTRKRCAGGLGCFHGRVAASAVRGEKLGETCFQKKTLAYRDLGRIKFVFSDGCAR